MIFRHLAGTPEQSTMISRNTATLVVLIAFLSIISGCGSPKVKGLVPVRGTVYFKDVPLEDASITFTPKEFKDDARIATGQTDSKGVFELRTIGEKGALPGEYLVSIVKNRDAKPTAQTTESVPPHERNSKRSIESVIPKNYNNPKNSGLEYIVTVQGPNDYRIEL